MLAAVYPVQRLGNVTGLSRSTFSSQTQENAELDLREAVEAVAVEYPRYGSRRITAELQRRGWQINRKHVQRVMREENLLVHVRRSCHTTMSQHGYGRYPNLVKHLEIVRPDQVWCADLTSIRLPRQFVSLAVLMDIFTRRIRGWEMAAYLREDLPKAALQRALAQGQPEIHHSDQGVQYAATGYVSLLQAAKVEISMAKLGTPTENAYAERLMRTLKEEEVSLHDYEDLTDARAHIAHFLDEVSMTKRVHSALGYVPPAEFEALWSAEHLET
jgi:transposase InsO family protein